MTYLAQSINERKRRLESLEQLATWEGSIEGWEGPGILESSSHLIRQGEALKIVSTGRVKEVVLFLFDHLLVFCKKVSV